MSDTRQFVPFRSPTDAAACLIHVLELSVSAWLLPLGLIGMIAISTRSADAASGKPEASTSVSLASSVI
jgi:hypothetical protein